MILVGSSPTSISEAPASNPPAPFFAVRNCGGMAMAEGCPGSKPAKLQGKGRVRRKMASTSCHGRSVFFLNKGYREKKTEDFGIFGRISLGIKVYFTMIGDDFRFFYCQNHHSTGNETLTESGWKIKAMVPSIASIIFDSTAHVGSKVKNFQHQK